LFEESEDGFVKIWYHPEIDMFEIRFEDVDQIVGLTSAEMLELKNKVQDMMKKRHNLRIS